VKLFAAFQVQFTCVKNEHTAFIYIKEHCSLLKNLLAVLGLSWYRSDSC